MSSVHVRRAGAALAWLGALALVATACGAERDRAPAAGTTAGSVADTPASDACLEAGATLTGEGVGALRIGATVQSLRERCRIVRDTTVRDIEGQPQRTLAVLAGDDTLTAEVLDDRVWRLQVTTPSPRTADSLGVGVPLERMLRLPEVRGLRGEGTLFVVSPRYCGLSFQLSDSGMDENVSDWTPEALRRLSPSTFVTRVLAVGCSPADQPAPSPVSDARPPRP